MKLIEFMASGLGRILRLVAGLVLVIVGISLVTGPSVVAGSIVGIVGLVPLFAPLFGAPFLGTHIRQQAHLS